MSESGETPPDEKGARKFFTFCRDDDYANEAHTAQFHPMTLTFLSFFF